MKVSSLFNLFLTIVFLTFISCEKEEERSSIAGEIFLTSSTEYPLGVVNDWTNLNNANTYELFRSENAESYEMIVSLDNSTTTYFDNTAIEDVEYQYYVKGVNTDMDGSITSNITTGKAVPLTTDNSFGLLAELTGGTMFQYGTSDSLTDLITMIIDSFATDSADIMFLIDKTGSMADDIFAVQTGLSTIIAAMPPNCRLGLASYGDLMCDSIWPDSSGSGLGNWYDFHDLTLNHFDVQNLVNSLTTTGGCDFPESVFDGLHRTISMANWQANNKLLLVIGDAPPLVTPCIYPLTAANNPDECTQHDIMDVVNSATSNNVITNIYPVVNTNWKGGGN